MTWGEFKQRVEAAGVQDEDEIGHIDVTTPGVGPEFTVKIAKRGGSADSGGPATTRRRFIVEN